jgi:hypothetical protein
MSTEISNQKTTGELRYNSTNPFLSGIVEYVEEGKSRKVVGHTWQDIVDKPTGDTKKQKVLILGEQKVVDTQEYSKVFMGEIKRFFGLSKSSLLLLDYIMENIRYNQDRICLYYPDIKERLSMHKGTMYAAIKQMITVNIIARASTPGCYYINPAVVFKGERLTVVQEYIRSSVPSELEIPEELTNEQEYILADQE